MGRERENARDISGILLLDKAKGESSNRALQRVKRIFGARKAGHTGSLDPLATGVLPICFGEATKVSQFLLEAKKRYLVKIKLGERTDSGDSQGKIIEVQERIKVNFENLRFALKKFEGEIKQLPPMYSALKHKGVPLYKLAREGRTVERKLRAIKIYENTLVNFDDNIVEIDVTCSKGTYIRSLADDLGQDLGCGAHVIELRRTQAGRFSTDGCKDLEKLESIKESKGLSALDELLIPMDQAIVEMPQVFLEHDTAKQIKHGQFVRLDELPRSGLVRLYEEEVFIGIGAINSEGKLSPRRLIAI